MTTICSYNYRNFLTHHFQSTYKLPTKLAVLCIPGMPGKRTCTQCRLHNVKCKQNWNLCGESCSTCCCDAAREYKELLDLSVRQLC